MQEPTTAWVFSLENPQFLLVRRGHSAYTTVNIHRLGRMRVPLPFSSASSAKLCIALVLGVVCCVALLVSPGTRNVDNMQRAWESLWPFRSAKEGTLAVLAQGPLPSISAGAKYYAVSQDSKGRDDLEFDKKVTLFIETSQARIELLVATLESNPARAKTCANTLEGSVCSKLNSVMTDAVTSLNQAELAIDSYQTKGVVADPVLDRLQKQVKELKAVNARYPGIGPKVTP